MKENNETENKKRSKIKEVDSLTTHANFSSLIDRDSDA